VRQHRRVAIAMMGRPASGKTTLARYLSRSLDGVLISSCEIKQAMRPEYQTKDCLDEALREQAYDEAVRRCKGVLEEGGLPVVDAGFHTRALRGKLYGAAREMGAALILIYCQCDDLREVLRRIRARTKGPRTPDKQGDSPEIFHYLTCRFKEPVPLEVDRSASVVFVRTDKGRRLGYSLGLLSVS